MLLLILKYFICHFSKRVQKSQSSNEQPDYFKLLFKTRNKGNKPLLITSCEGNWSARLRPGLGSLEQQKALHPPRPSQSPAEFLGPRSLSRNLAGRRASVPCGSPCLWKASTALCLNSVLSLVHTQALENSCVLCCCYEE